MIFWPLRREELEGLCVIREEQPYPNVQLTTPEESYCAMLYYEINCTLKYDRDFPYSGSLPIPQGERLIDFAMMFKGDPKQMQNMELEVNRRLDKMTRMEMSIIYNEKIKPHLKERTSSLTYKIR